jgi:hypothetical protein
VRLPHESGADVHRLCHRPDLHPQHPARWAGVLMVVLPVNIWVSGAPFAVTVVAVFA